jgi:hypothetical protein
VSIGEISVISSATLGAIGVILPTVLNLVNRKQDREHEHDLWLRDKRTAIYQELLIAVLGDIVGLEVPERDRLLALTYMWGTLMVTTLFEEYLQGMDDKDTASWSVGMLTDQIRSELRATY